MNNKLNISIPTPCHENWEAMSPREQGKYCGVCSTTVVDFSSMDDQQVLNYLNNKQGRICGRLSSNQIATPQSRFEQLSSKMKYFVFALGFVFFGFSSELAFSQSNITDTTQTQNNYGSISGKVIDDQGTELDFALVKILQDGLVKSEFYTDEVGNYKFTKLDIGVYVIEVKYLGYAEFKSSKVVVEENTTTVKNVTLEKKLTNNKGVQVITLGLLICDPVINELNPGQDKYNQDQIRTILGGE